MSKFVEKKGAHLVFKIDDMIKYLNSIQCNLIDCCMEQIVESRKKDNKRHNKYLVINCDEPYAEEIFDVIKKGEEEKEENKMTFSQALDLLKVEHKVARKGWNGKDMFVVYQKGYPQGIPANKQTAVAWGIKEGDLFKCEPYLQLKMTNGSHAMWVPSINDILADDWFTVA